MSIWTLQKRSKRSEEGCDLKDKNDMTQEEPHISDPDHAEEMPQYRGIVIPEEGAEQKRLLRSLMNVRPPMPASSDF